jgi:hypothetical protein
MDISIQTDMTVDGTKVTADGKAIKKVEGISFQMYETSDYDSLTQSFGEPYKVICCHIRTEETDADGVEREINYEFEKRGDTVVKDSKTDGGNLSVQDAVNSIMGQLGTRKP